MSRLAREYPEASYDELFDLAMKITVPLKEGEKTYPYECRSCGDSVQVSEDTHKRYESSRATGIGFTMPKCGDCWS